MEFKKKLRTIAFWEGENSFLKFQLLNLFASILYIKADFVQQISSTTL